MIWLALAAQVSTLTAMQTLLTPDDVPVAILKQNVLQVVEIALTITPEGDVQSCQIEVSSGDPRLDSYTCAVVSRRVKRRMFSDYGGGTGYRLYRMPITWWVGDGLPPKHSSPADLYISVSSLPSPLRGPVQLHLYFAVDAGGRIGGCASEDQKPDATLTVIACEQLAKAFKAAPLKLRDGTAVQSVQNATVQFDTK
jgi:hypothetical protein